LNPETVQNVVTYTAVIDVDNPDLKLKPGMTANVTVTVAERRDVLKLPNAALRFKPAELTPAQQKEMAKLMSTFGPPGQGREGARPTDGVEERQPGSPRPTRWTGAQTPLVRKPETRPGMNVTTTAITGWSTANNERPRVQVIWIMGANTQMRMVPVKLGITDGVHSEVMEGELKENDVIVLGQNTGPNGNTAQRPTAPFGGPFGGGPPRR
jgi:HlyD family secretion protein